MKTCLFYLPVFLLYSLTSCKTNKISETAITEEKFEYIQLGDHLYSITVRNYDSVSFYESPYQRYMFENNKPDGKFVVYDEHNRIRRVLFYSNHKREGADTWFYKDGQIMQEKIFVNDRTLSYKSYYPQSQQINTILTDTLGYKRHFDEKGYLIFEKNYVTGTYKEWFSDGRIRATGTECPGECFTLHGPWYFYSDAGKLERIAFYSDTTDSDNWDSVYHYQGNKIVSIERK
jgi:antitoxin component YwqK of YwqJK toxin-antitoxin module